MSEFVQQQVTGRGRTRPKAFHEDDKIFVSTDGASNGRKNTSSEVEGGREDSRKCAKLREIAKFDFPYSLYRSFRNCLANS